MLKSMDDARLHLLQLSQPGLQGHTVARVTVKLSLVSQCGLSLFQNIGIRVDGMGLHFQCARIPEPAEKFFC